jgi:hypothetical protein
VTDVAAPRFLYLHFPKAGGVSFRTVLEDAFAAGEILHVIDTDAFAGISPDALGGYRFIHGHFTFDHVAHLDGFVKIVTLRDLVERCLSTYDFWRGLDPGAPHWSAGAGSRSPPPRRFRSPPSARIPITRSPGRSTTIRRAC